MHSVLRSRIIVFIAIVQSILFLGHWFLYVTLVRFFGPAASSSAVKIALAVLSVSFIGASLRAWYSYRRLVRVLYTISAVWLCFALPLPCASLLFWVFFCVSPIFCSACAPPHHSTRPL